MIVQSVGKSSGADAVASLTIGASDSWDAPVAGNRLVAFFSGNSGTINNAYWTDEGWSVLHTAENIGQGTGYVRVFSKTANGTETSVTGYADPTNMPRVQFHLFEVPPGDFLGAGAFASSTADVVLITGEAPAVPDDLVLACVWTRPFHALTGDWAFGYAHRHHTFGTTHDVSGHACSTAVRDLFGSPADTSLTVPTATTWHGVTVAFAADPGEPPPNTDITSVPASTIVGTPANLVDKGNGWWGP